MHQRAELAALRLGRMTRTARRDDSRVRWLSWLVAAGLLLRSRAALAGHPELALHYERAPGAEACAGTDALRGAVAARLGYDPFVLRSDVDTIVVQIHPLGSGLAGTIERRDPSRHARGKSTTIASKSADCVELGSALAVGIAIAVDPLSLTTEHPAVASSPPPTAPSAGATRPGAEERPLEPESRSPTSFVLAAGASLSFGALPRTSLGARVLAGLSRGMFEVDIEGRFDPSVALRTQGGSVEASFVLGTVAPCFRYEIALACAQLSFGALRGAGIDFDRTHEENTFYMAAGARAGVDIPFSSRMSLRVLAEGQVPLRLTRLEVNGASVWSTPSFAFSAMPLLVGRFP